MNTTPSPRLPRARLGAIVAAALLFSLSAVAQPVTVFSDNFAAATVNAGPFNSTTPVGVTSGANVWLSSSSALLTAPGGGVLAATNATASGIMMLTYIAPSGSPVQLGLGEQLKLTFDVSLTATPTAPSTLRVALFNTGAERPIYSSAGLTSAGSSSNSTNSTTQTYLNWRAYRADVSMTNRQVSIWERLQGSSTAMISTNATWNNANVQASPTAASAPTPGTFYTVTVTVYRTPQGTVWVSSSLSGGDLTEPVSTGVWVDNNTWGGSSLLTAGTTTAFDALGINVAAGHAYQFKNFLVQKSAQNPSRLSNLSIRNNAGADAQTLIVGFVTEGGTQNASLLVRAAGPALVPYVGASALTDPKLTIFNRDSVQLFTNDDWNATLASTFTQLGAFDWATGSKDSALALTPAAAPYSAHVSGVGGATGITLAEIYDANTTFAAANPLLTNVSARAQVGTGDNIMIAGFVIDGDTGRQLLIRAVGPELTTYGVPGVLADPQLTIYRGTTQIATNDDWPSTLSLTFTQLGAFSLSATSKDSAILLGLPPGIYTAQVSGVGGTTGVSLVEIYAVP